MLFYTEQFCLILAKAFGNFQSIDANATAPVAAVCILALLSLFLQWLLHSFKLYSNQLHSN